MKAMKELPFKKSKAYLDSKKNSNEDLSADKVITDKLLHEKENKTQETFVENYEPSVELQGKIGFRENIKLGKIIKRRKKALHILDVIISEKARIPSFKERGMIKKLLPDFNIDIKGTEEYDFASELRIAKARTSTFMKIHARNNKILKKVKDRESFEGKLSGVHKKGIIAGVAALATSSIVGYSGLGLGATSLAMIGIASAGVGAGVIGVGVIIVTCKEAFIMIKSGKDNANEIKGDTLLSKEFSEVIGNNSISYDKFNLGSVKARKGNISDVNLEDLNELAKGFADKSRKRLGY